MIAKRFNRVYFAILLAATAFAVIATISTPVPAEARVSQQLKIWIIIGCTDNCLQPPPNIQPPVFCCTGGGT